MKKLNVKIKIIVLAIFLSLTLGLTIYYCSWIYQNNSQLNQELTKKIDNLNQIYLKISKIKTEKEQLGTLKNNIDKIDKSFLPNNREDFLNFIVELENIASNRSLSIDKQLGSTEKSKYPGIDIAPLKITLEGNYKNIILFFNQLEKLPQILNIYSANIQGGKDENTTKATIMVDTYWKKS